ncbi:hypothetical protein PHIM7_299 [Sinorhizobium phage phiM7]|uniref:Uncharacterized protein n=2 Tax=Emdodecavirus TaxID=1980937 RepID=S5MBP3_9CAUD|nr:hypothetical protein AB690_gp212 [Sinorhizobium phage phiM12]YP_009601424.1 hypothetical protein FDH46_gp179 [Sinorhizobium phage phiM7]AGR48018.1 hypothetical protein SmphiM12_386 [Sinorhizobium phage phiM12]AKF12845.1 hypothetical protein PHIM7_299 [Sinorhizobium phage phiM7]AKF13204.1 hypothetical protein PHIM19_299 [Sinorhizobium phage phiM19]
MNKFSELPARVQDYLMPQIRQYFGKYATITDRDEIKIMYPNQDFQPVHGYVSITPAATKYDYNEVWICDNTPDSGDIVAVAYSFR